MFCDEELFKVLYLCIHFVQKTAQLILEKLHNSGMVGCRKLPDPSLSHILMLCRLLYNMRSHFNELILA